MQSLLDQVFVDEPYSIVNFRSTEEHSELRETLQLTVEHLQTLCVAQFVFKVGEDV